MIEKRKRAFLDLHEYTLNCMDNPELLTYDKVYYDFKSNTDLCVKITSMLSCYMKAVRKKELTKKFHEDWALISQIQLKITSKPSLRIGELFQMVLYFI